MKEHGGFYKGQCKRNKCGFGEIRARSDAECKKKYGSDYVCCCFT